jgi:hypothetical protein
MTGQERDQVRALVERTCAAQGVPLVVPVDVAQAVARMIAGRPHRPLRPIDPAVSDDGAGDGRAPLAG